VGAALTFDDVCIRCNKTLKHNILPPSSCRQESRYSGIISGFLDQQHVGLLALSRGLSQGNLETPESKLWSGYRRLLIGRETGILHLRASLKEQVLVSQRADL